MSVRAGACMIVSVYVYVYGIGDGVCVWRAGDASPVSDGATRSSLPKVLLGC